MAKRTNKIKRLLINLIGFFPVRLLLLHLRRSLLLLIFWVILFGVVAGLFLDNIGVKYLFQTPEYLQSVSPASYFIMGLVLGLFVMAFHISSYIFYSYRFPFLATLNRPLFTFSINNSIIPITFYLFYSVIIVSALSGEGQGFFQIVLSILGLYFGSMLTIGISLTYFFSTNKTLHIEGFDKPLKVLIRKDKSLEEPSIEDSKKVKTYLKSYFKIRLTREHAHYTDKQKLDTLQKHHLNAAIFFVVILGFMVVLSLFVLNPIFQIPAGASIILIFTIYIMVIGALYSRFKTWTLTITIVLFIGFNYFSGHEKFQRIHKAFGLDYSTNANYTIETIDSLTHPILLENDKLKMLGALKNWRDKFTDTTSKPKMVILNCSGGGLRASLWAMAALQSLDSSMSGEFLDHVFLITGSSGGMLGSAYYRELKYRENNGLQLGIHRRDYYNRLGSDLLNAVGFTLAVNDLFIPLKKVKYGDEKYVMDRGYAWEHRLLEMTDSILDKRIIDYRDIEYNAEIPLLILSPMMINAGRRMLISPQGISFLARNYNAYDHNPSYEIDGVEFMRFFEKQDAGNLQFSTALRMSATFPYVTPLVSLPSKPRIELIDAGARDNDGFNLGLRFMDEFNSWIEENTSGVVVVKLLANREQKVKIKDNKKKTRLDGLTKPISGVISSFSNLQGFKYSEDLKTAESWMTFPMDIYSLELLSKDADISLSWHLTNREKDRIYKKVRSAPIEKDIEAIKMKLGLNEERN